MKEKIELLALLRDPLDGVRCYQDPLYHHHHSGTPSSHRVAIARSLCGGSSWEAASIVIHPISERIIPIRLKTHLSYASIIAIYPPTAIYAPTNPVISNVDASLPSDNFYDQLLDTLSSVRPRRQDHPPNKDIPQIRTPPPLPPIVLLLISTKLELELIMPCIISSILLGHFKYILLLKHVFGFDRTANLR